MILMVAQGGYDPHDGSHPTKATLTDGMLQLQVTKVDASLQHEARQVGARKDLAHEPGRARASDAVSARRTGMESVLSWDRHGERPRLGR